MGNKRILMVGECDVLGNFKYFLEGSDKGFSLDDFAGSAKNAFDKINNGNYWGLLANSLKLSKGFELEKKYEDLISKYDDFDYPPFVFNSCGLAVVDYAIGKGLNVVVSRIAEERKELLCAEKLGAICVNNDIGNYAMNVHNAFASFG
jgi:hypothetical protein